MTTKEKIEVMQAHVDGKTIEILSDLGKNVWNEIKSDILWNWVVCEYRIKPELNSDGTLGEKESGYGWKN